MVMVLCPQEKKFYVDICVLAAKAPTIASAVPNIAMQLPTSHSHFTTILMLTT